MSMISDDHPALADEPVRWCYVCGDWIRPHEPFLFTQLGNWICIDCVKRWEMETRRRYPSGRIILPEQMRKESNG